jgi:hypothetical protein
MHCRQLVEIAALLAVHAPRIAQRPGSVPPACVEQYWTASKCRIDRWLRLLRQLAAAADQAPRPPATSWPRVRPVLEEIFASELLTRVWTAVAAAYDRARQDQELEPFARNILVSHLAARRRLLALLTDGRTFSVPQAQPLNHLRRRVERWNDMLLAHLADQIDIEELAFDPRRARDFAADLDRDAARGQQRLTSQLVLASIRGSFAQGLADGSPNADLNARIGSAILTAFGEEIGDATGLVTSLWLDRMARTAAHTEGMIEELLRLDVRA